MKTYRLEGDLGLAGKTSLIKAQWRTVFGEEPTPVLQGALDTFRCSDPHPDKATQPESQGGFYVELALSADPEAPYRTLWFSRQLNEQEQSAIETGFQLVVAGLFKPSVGQ